MMFNDYEEEKANQLYDLYKNDFPEKLENKSVFELSFKNAQKQYEESLKEGR